MSDYDPMAAAPPPHPSRQPPAPPVSNLPPPYRGPFSIGAVFSHGWLIFTRYYGLLLAGAAVLMGISMAINAVEAVINLVAAPAGSLVGLAASFFLMPVLQTGLSFLAARAARGEVVAFDHMLDGFRRYWPIVGVNAMVGLIFMGIATPFVAAIVAVAALGQGSNAEAVIIAALVVVLVAICIALFPRLTFAPVICLDPVAGEGVFGAIRRSWEITGPHWGALVALHFLLWLMAAGSVLLLCIGLLLVGMPLLLAVTGTAYAALMQPAGQRTHCQHCGYDLSDLNTRVCPECGTMTGGHEDPAVA